MLEDRDGDNENVQIKFYKESMKRGRQSQRSNSSNILLDYQLKEQINCMRELSDEDAEQS